MYEIALSGILASQAGINVVANNIANATTEGYHCQELALTTSSTGQGVETAGIKSLISTTLEYQLLTQEADNEAIAIELENLQYLENVLGELNGGLSESLDEFFETLSALSSSPDDVSLQNDVIVSAETLVSKFNTLASQIDSLKETLIEQAEQIVDNVNKLSQQIAELNELIANATVSGKDTNNLEDQRWQVIYELNELTGCTISEGENGMIDVKVGGTAVVLGTTALSFSISQDTATDTLFLNGTFLEGITTCSGQLGGILTTYNDLLKGYESQIDTLAGVFINEVNNLYSQGVGASGSFTQLTGWSVESTRLSELEPTLDFSEDLYINITYTDGTTERIAINIDSSDTLTTVCQKIDALTGVQCRLSSDNCLIIQTDSSENGASFDFTAGTLDTVDTTSWSGGGTSETLPPEIAISGSYSGNENQTFQCEIVSPSTGACAIGTGDLSLNIYLDGVLVNTVNIGEGYEPGTAIEIAEGIEVTFSANTGGVGYVNDGDSFEISALADSDPCGFLSAIGWNCMFSGNDAGSITLREDAASGSLSIYASDETSGNSLIQALADLCDEELDKLDSLSISDYAQNIGVQLGIDVAALEAKQENSETLLNELSNQQQEVSGVDTNSETLKMLGYEQLFQAMSQYITILSGMYDTLFSAI